jgi:cytochrome bd-type quinol oxidase subunit 2
MLAMAFALGAIVKSRFQVDSSYGFLWALLFFCLMFILIKFKHYAERKLRSRVVAFLVWCFVTIAVAIIGLGMGCHFWPQLCQPTP